MRSIAISTLFVAALLVPDALLPQTASSSSASADFLVPKTPEGEITCSCLSGTPENEPDCGLSGGGDTVNGGCNFEPNVFSSIQCGQTICGTTGAIHNELRDTDWYELVLAGPSVVEVHVVAQFQSFAGILHTAGGPPVCDPSADWLFVQNLVCEPGIDRRALSAGTWWIFVAQNAFTGLACGTPYTLTVTCPIFASDFESPGALCFWSDTNPPVLCE